GTFSDPAPSSGINLSSFQLIVDGADVTPSTVVGPAGFAYVPVVPLADGLHTISANVADSAGNPAVRAVANYNVLTQLPPRPVIDPNRTVYGVNTVTIGGNAPLNIASLIVNADPSIVVSWTVAGGAFSITLTTDPVGSTNYSAAFKDQA